MSRLACRQQMHNAERLARVAATGASIPDHLIVVIEAAYASPNCEPRVAQRIQVALDCM